MVVLLSEQLSKTAAVLERRGRFSSSHFLPESARTLAAIAFHAARKIGEEFLVAPNFAGNAFQQGISDGCSLLGLCDYKSNPRTARGAVESRKCGGQQQRNWVQLASVIAARNPAIKSKSGKIRQSPAQFLSKSGCALIPLLLHPSISGKIRHFLANSFNFRPTRALRNKSVKFRISPSISGCARLGCTLPRATVRKDHAKSAKNETRQKMVEILFRLSLLHFYTCTNVQAPFRHSEFLSRLGSTFQTTMTTCAVSPLTRILIRVVV